MPGTVSSFTSYQQWHIRHWLFISVPCLCIIAFLIFSSIKQLYSKVGNSRRKWYGNAVFSPLASSISRHEGILNKRSCKNFFEKNGMPVFLWRFQYGRRRLNSNNESHWLQVSAYKLLEFYSSNMDMQHF